MELTVPKEDNWIDFVERHSDSLCSGLGSCGHCNKKMLPVRGKYLRSWLRTYIDNKQDIISGKLKLDKLNWIPFDTAPKYNIGEFHIKHCSEEIAVEKCQCDIAHLLRSLYHNVNDDSVECSVEMIYSTYKKMLGKSNK